MVSYISYLFADWLHLLNCLIDDVANLLGDFSLFFLLQLLISGLLLDFFLLVWNILKQCAFTDLVAILIDNVTIVVDLLADTSQEVAVSESTDDIAVLVTDLSFFVDA